MAHDTDTVTVTILEKDYQISCQPSEEQALRKSAKYLDEQMSKIRSRGNIIGLDKIAVMAALNISHELLKKTRLVHESKSVTEQQVQGLQEKIEHALQASRQIEI